MTGVDAVEVAIVGGGPAGAAAALALARAGRAVLLLEKDQIAAFKIGEALPPAVKPLLRDLGVWERFVADGHLPCYANLSAWGSDSLQSADFINDPNGRGWHLDRPRFDAFLRAEARAAGADVRAGSSIQAYEWQPVRQEWALTLEDGDRVRSQWLVDASGRRSIVARQQGIRRQADDALVGIYALFQPPSHSQGSDRDSSTLIESGPDGWWYTARVPSGQRVVVYLTDADLLSRAARTQPGFQALVTTTRHIRARLAEHGYRLGEAPKGVAAQSARLERFGGEGWLAIGDAALSFDPLSSQGILTALYTGMTAGQALHAHFSGEGLALEAYSERLATIYEVYLRNRDLCYAAETRWLDRPFWHRRIGERARARYPDSRDSD
ncbi:MAG TPA: FAD-dependent oxidoreductase [Ardenticatenaceae bacterium]|nr:FAD-dependent oxidoreductase [Ardenticatenaceae bacterium]